MMLCDATCSYMNDGYMLKIVIQYGKLVNTISARAEILSCNRFTVLTKGFANMNISLCFNFFVPVIYFLNAIPNQYNHSMQV